MCNSSKHVIAITKQYQRAAYFTQPPINLHDEDHDHENAARNQPEACSRNPAISVYTCLFGNKGQISFTSSMDAQYKVLPMPCLSPRQIKF